MCHYLCSNTFATVSKNKKFISDKLKNISGALEYQSFTLYYHQSIELKNARKVTGAITVQKILISPQQKIQL